MTTAADEARIHPLSKFTFQKSMNRAAGITSLQELLKQLWDRRAIGLTVDAPALDSLIDEDRFRCQSQRQIQGATKCRFTVWPF
jgi:hypothetical protein